MKKKRIKERKFMRSPLAIEDGIFGILRNPKKENEQISANILDLSKGGLKFAVQNNKGNGLIEGDILFLTEILGTANWKFRDHAELEIRWIQHGQLEEDILIGSEFKYIPEIEKVQFERFIQDELNWNRSQIMPQHIKRTETISETSHHFQNQTRTLILGGAAFLIMFAVFFFLLNTEQKTFKKEIGFVHTRIDQIVRGLPVVDQGIEEKLSSSDKVQGSLQEPIPQSVDLLRVQLHDLTTAIDQLNKNIESVSPKNTQSNMQQASLQTKYNYHEVGPGENLYRIGKNYGMSVEALRRLNNLRPNQSIYPGQKLLVASSN